MTVWSIRDTQTTELPGFELGWLPGEAYQYVTPRVITRRLEGSVIAIEAGPYVGALPLRNGDVLHIVPRAGHASFWRMLLLSEGLTDSVRDEFEDVARLGQSSEGETEWAYLLYRTFLQQLRRIEKNSLRPGRTALREQQRSVRGRVDLVPTILGVARRDANPVHTTSRVRTYDTAEHRVLGAAAHLLYSMSLVADEDRDVAIRWAERHPSRQVPGADLRHVIAGLHERRYTGPRHYYIPALLMARLVLAQSGVALDSHEEIPSEALLANVWDTYERYVRAVLANALTPRGLTVEKLRAGTPSLFTDGTCDLEPDAIVSDATGTRLLVDTKYKPGNAIESSDYHQMAAYLRGYGCNTGMLILPRSHNGQQIVTERVMHDGGRVYELRLPLEDWAESERLLEETVSRTVGL